MSRRNHKMNKAKKLARDKEIMELAAQGHSLASIGRNVGLSGERVRVLIKEIREEILLGSVEEYKEYHNYVLLERIEKERKKEDTQASLAIVRLLERLAKLNGLDAPPKGIEVNHSVSHAWDRVIDAVSVPRRTLEGGTINGYPNEIQAVRTEGALPHEAGRTIEHDPDGEANGGVSASTPDVSMPRLPPVPFRPPQIVTPDTLNGEPG